MDYHFNDKTACLYGVEEATMLNNLYYWVLKNKANNKHFHDGYYWTYNSLKAFEKLFPFWTKRQIERILNNLEKKGAIITGNYNKVGYDRTKWYTITEMVLSIYANGEIDFTEWGNGNHETVSPIPNNKPNSKNTDNKPNSISTKVDICKSEDLLRIQEAWNNLELSKIKSISNNRLKLLKARIKEYSVEEVVQAIESINNSSFLRGQNNRSWVITFDWLIKPNNFTKVLEGNYLDKKGGGGNDPSDRGVEDKDREGIGIEL